MTFPKMQGEQQAHRTLICLQVLSILCACVPLIHLARTHQHLSGADSACPSISVKEIQSMWPDIRTLVRQIRQSYQAHTVEPSPLTIVLEFIDIV